MEKECKCGRGPTISRHGCRSCHNEYAREYQRNRYEERRTQAVEILGGVCVDCGTTDNLEFDHVDPSTKEFAIGDMFSKYSWEKIEQELIKCVLRCKPCHGIKSLSNGDIYSVEHGGGLSGKKNCKCPPCKAKKAEYMSEYAITYDRPSRSMSRV